MSTILFTFPNLNQWSSPLLFFTSQGLIFAVLLFIRWYKKSVISDLLLALLLGILCYHRTTYIIGFMDWYDTFRNTKVNYYLIPLGLATGPLLYFYVKSVTSSAFRFRREHIYHFVPVVIYIVYRIVILIYDSAQPGFAETQNGVLMEDVHNQYVGAFYSALQNVQHLLYLAFTVQLFLQYKAKIKQFYSNTYKLELSWLRNFLAIYILLFVYSLFETMTDLVVMNLHWTQRWWYHLIAACAIIYIGIKGYFTDTGVLTDLEFDRVRPTPISLGGGHVEVNTAQYLEQKVKVSHYMESKSAYLDPDLSLKSLASGLNYTPGQLSEVINSGFGVNFNDFVNRYRIEAIKSKIDDKMHLHLSLVAIAMDCGFNSMATFNRVFKKLTGMSPTQYVNQSQ